MRASLAVAIAVALIVGTTMPAMAYRSRDHDGRRPSPRDGDALRALSPLDGGRQPHGAAPAASASPDDEGEDEGPTPSPSPAPSLSPGAPVPRPFVPIGPGVLVPPPLPSTTPRVTPPPLPSPTPSPSPGPSGPIYLTPAVPPTATPSPAPPPTAGPIVAGPRATPTPTAAPSPGETLGPNDYAILGDTLTGNRTPGHRSIWTATSTSSIRTASWSAITRTTTARAHRRHRQHLHPESRGRRDLRRRLDPLQHAHHTRSSSTAGASRPRASSAGGCISTRRTWTFAPTASCTARAPR